MYNTGTVPCVRNVPINRIVLDYNDCDQDKHKDYFYMSAYTRIVIALYHLKYRDSKNHRYSSHPLAL